MTLALGTSPIKTTRERRNELTINVWESTGSELLSVIRQASSGNQSRIRVGSFPGRMSSLPARRLKTVRIEQLFEKHRERRSRHVTWTRDRTRETNRTTQRNPFAARSAPARMQNVTSDSFAPRPRKNTIHSPHRYEHGRSTLVKIPSDSSRPEGSTRKRAGMSDDSVLGNRSLRTIFAIIRACQVIVPFLSPS